MDLDDILFSVSSEESLRVLGIDECNRDGKAWAKRMIGIGRAFGVGVPGGKERPEEARFRGSGLRTLTH